MATNNKFMQISSLGSADPKNQEIQSGIRTLELRLPVDPALDPEGGKFMENESAWEASPNNPIITDFQSIFTNPNIAKDFDEPDMQNKMFDVDNMVKGTSGVYRTQQQGLVSFGSDIDGKPLYTMPDIRDDKNFDLGKNRLYTTGTIVQQLGVFDNEEDSDNFAKLTQLSGDPNFMGRVEGLNGQGDKKGAVNAILTEFGYPELDSLDSHPDKKRAYGIAFAAYNYAQNSEKLSPSQKSLAMSTMATMSYKFKDGTSLSDRPVIKDEDGVTKMSVSDAMALAGSGVDVYSLQKNWDQIDAMQRLTYGEGTVSQMAATGQRMGLLGDPTMGGASVRQTPEQLGEAGFTSVPSAGLGAITGNEEMLPEGYEVVGAGEQPGQVIAVPKGLSFSASTINGTTDIRSLNTAPGVKKAGTGAFKVHSRWMPTGRKTDNTRGTSFASGIGQSGITKDPYLASAMAATSVYGNTVTSRKLQAKRDAKKDLGNIGKGGAAASGYSAGGGAGVLLSNGQVIAAGAPVPAGVTAVGSAPLPAAGVPAAGIIAGGLTGAAQISGANKAIKGEDMNVAEEAALFLPSQGMSVFVDPIRGAFGGGKSKEQKGRDGARAIVEDITNGDWALPLSDGGFGDIGTDGKGGQHEFRFPEKDPHQIGRSLHAYDVDYTNDLDFTANMMTSSFMRLMAGGKGTSIDQVSGQLANASLGKVGFGQDMTQENFNYVRDNIRGWFFKKGIQTKEDAYALSNQMATEGRIAEMDLMALQQGINMTFDDNGFDTANVLMSGRWKGLEVAGDISKSPGPNFEALPIQKLPGDLSGVKPVPRPTSDAGFEDLDLMTPEEFEMQFDAGTYGGNSNTNAFTNSIIKYEKGTVEYENAKKFATDPNWARYKKGAQAYIGRLKENGVI